MSNLIISCNEENNLIYKSNFVSYKNIYFIRVKDRETGEIIFDKIEPIQIDDGFIAFKFNYNKCNKKIIFEIYENELKVKSFLATTQNMPIGSINKDFSIDLYKLYLSKEWRTR